MRTSRTSQGLQARVRFSVSAPVGHACAQFPHDSQAVTSQSGPNGASIVVRTPALPLVREWLHARRLQAATQRWQVMHRLGS